MTTIHTPELSWPGSWWACSEPERPPDGGVTYDEKCPACMLKAHADAPYWYGDRQLRTFQHEDGHESPMTFFEFLARFG